MKMKWNERENTIVWLISHDDSFNWENHRNWIMKGKMNKITKQFIKQINQIDWDKIIIITFTTNQIKYKKKKKTKTKIGS